MLLTRHDQSRIDKGEMMTVEDVLELLAVPLLGIVPESTAVLRASNTGMPVVLDEPSSASAAYDDAVGRLLGGDIPMRIPGEKRPGFIGRLFGRSA